MQESKEELSLSKKIGSKQLTKLKQIPLPPNVDLTLSRIYFSGAHEGFSRILILVAHVFWIGLVFFNGISLGQIVANSPIFPSVPDFQKAAVQVVTMLLTIFSAFIILIMLLPIFLTKTIKGIQLTCIFYLMFGTIISLLINAISFYLFFDSKTPYRTTMLILTVASLPYWWFAIISWLISGIRAKRKLIKSIIKMYDLSFK